MKTHYQTLGLKEGASQDEIKEAYERLSKELDPTNNHEDFFVEEYIKVREAYKDLSSSSILATEVGARNQGLKDSNSNVKKQVSENTENNKKGKTKSESSDWGKILKTKFNKRTTVYLAVLMAITLIFIIVKPYEKISEWIRQEQVKTAVAKERAVQNFKNRIGITHEENEARKKILKAQGYDVDD